MSRDGIIDVRHPVNYRDGLARGLVAWWKAFDGWSGGTVFRDLVGGIHAALSNMEVATDWVQSDYGMSLDFDGVDESAVVSEPHNVPLGTVARTIVAWAKADTSTTGRFVGYGTSVASGNLFGLTVETITAVDYVLFRHAGGNIRYPAATIGEWLHAAITMQDGDNTDDALVYIDGLLRAGTRNAGADFAIDTQAEDFHIGEAFTGSGEYFDGQVAEVMVYDRALSADEIRALYEDSLRAYPRLLRRLSRRVAFVAAAPAARRVFIVS